MQSRWQLRDDAVSWTPTDDGQVVILDMRTSRYLSLNSSAAALWSRLADGAASGDDLIDHLVTRFEVTRERATGDVDGFLSELQQRDLVASDTA